MQIILGKSILFLGMQTPYNWDGGFNEDGVSHEVGIPVEVNYLLGQKNSHFVFGAGAYAGVCINEAILGSQTYMDSLLV